MRSRAWLFASVLWGCAALARARSVEAPEIDQLVEDAIAARRLPGAVVAIGHRDGLAFVRAYGERATLPAHEPMTHDTIFDLASLTKPVATATVVLQLAERGLVDLDAYAARYLPELRARGKGRIRVRELLLHSSGLPHVNPLRDYERGAEAALRSVFAVRPLAAPGARFEYSDLGYIVLGALAQRVTGETLDVLAQRELFGPLRMTDTMFRPPAALRARIAPTEVPDPSRPGATTDPIRGAVHDPRAFRLGGVAGSAGLFSTAHDLARYARMLLSGGELDGARVLQPRSVQLMAAPVALGEDVRTLGWDMRTRYSGLRGELLSPHAFGHGGYTGVSLFVDPDQDLFVIVLSNRVHPDGQGYVIDLAGAIADAASRAFGRAPLPASCTRLRGKVALGIDVLREQRFAPLAGKRVGLLANRSSVARDGAPTRELLAKAEGVTLAALFAPEHGLASDEEGAIGDDRDAATGVPVHSLFGKTRKPTAAMLRGIDALVFDLQDAGVRFFTYMSTLAKLLQAGAEHHLPVFVLDRPNPLGAQRAEGPVLQPGHASFVNYHPLPVVHGMTAGELARLLVHERRLRVDLRVIAMRGYARELPFAWTGLDWRAPSPNLPTLSAALLYPAVGLLESTNLSVGRGTERPFALVGAPFLDADALSRTLQAARLPGVRFAPVHFTPSADRYAGTLCHGVALDLTDARAFRAVRTGLTIAAALAAANRPDWNAPELGKLLAHDRALHALLSGSSAPALERLWERDLHAFAARRARHLLYPSCDAAP